MDSAFKLDLKSELKSTDQMQDSNQVDLSLFNQFNAISNKETSFIEPRHNGPSVLLKHNVSRKGLNDLQKSKSAPYLATNQIGKPVDNSNLLSNYSKSNVFVNYLTSSPTLFKNYSASSNLLTSTPNLFNLSKFNTLNTSKLIESPTSKYQQNHPVIRNSDTDSLNSSFPPALYVKNVSFDYQQNTVNSSNILRNVNLNCSIGSIYGLLGPSGCGKTTLIKLILAKFTPIAGTIKAFGYDVRNPYSGMNGPGVGYMPQETALIFDFTIEEHLTYFGRLYYMPSNKIRREINYLCGILDLPERTRLVKQLSGGQQHRVSFACALIHKPRLLILDEPTVGLDPILRERIWLQLLSLSKNFKITVLITTHYIEEAKRCDMVGFLRKGELLVEQTPKLLMKKYETNSLENIFFKICIEQIENKKAKDKLQHHIDVNFNNSVNELIEQKKQQEKSQDQQQTPSTSSVSSSPDLNELKLNNNYRNEYNTQTTNSTSTDDDLFQIPWVDHYDRSKISKWFIQFFAVIIKHFILTKRRPETVLAQYVLPLVAISAFCVCIGSTPNGIKIAVVNEENCGFPYDMNQNFTEPIPENSIEEFIKKFESLVGLRPSEPDPMRKRIVFRRRRSIDESITTLSSAAEMFNDEEEVTTTYPSKFNLMNNLKFNEHMNGEILKHHEPKSLNEIVASNSEDVSIDKLIATEQSLPSSVDSAIRNHRMSSSNNLNNSTLVPTTNPSVVVDDHPPVLMPVHDSNRIDEASNESNETVNEKLPSAYEDNEDNEELLEDNIPLIKVNSQFEDACFSQDLIRRMNSFIFYKIPYDSYEKAIEDVRSGAIWGVIKIKKGFSRAIISKILFQDYGDVNISNSLVEVNADLTNKALVITLDVTLSRLYPEFIKDVIAKANRINMNSNLINHTNFKFYNINSGRLPIILGSHVFKPKFTLSDYFGVREFAGPGLFIVLIYSISYALTVFSLVNEICDKMFDRHQCIGLSNNQLIFSLVITRFVFSASGIIVVMLMSIHLFDIANHGSFTTAVLLLLLQSYCGMTHGMLVSVLCPNIFVCASVSNGYLFLIFIISGVLWSFETLPGFMKVLGILMPSTIPCESLRTIMTRGQGFESDIVVYGFIVTIIWIIIHYVLTIVVFNYRKTSK